MEESDRAGIAEFIKRLEKLERQQRRTREYLILSASVAVILSLTLSGILAFGVGIGVRWWPRAVLRAREIRLIGPDRRPRAYLSVDCKGRAGLSLTDPHGKTRLSLCVRRDCSPYLFLTGPNGKSGLALDLRENRPGLFLRDKDHVQRAAIDVGRNEWAQLYFNDGRGECRMWLATAPDTGTGLVMYDKQGKCQAQLCVTKREKGYLALRDEHGNLEKHRW